MMSSRLENFNNFLDLLIFQSKIVAEKVEIIRVETNPREIKIHNEILYGTLIPELSKNLSMIFQSIHSFHVRRDLWPNYSADDIRRAAKTLEDCLLILNKAGVSMVFNKVDKQ